MAIITPFEQFRIKKIIYYADNLVLTSLLVSMLIVLSTYFYMSLINISTKKQKINMFSKHAHTLYSFVYSFIRSYIIERFRNTYFPFLFYLFLFVLLSNLAGLVPHVPTSTSHLHLSVSLSSIVWTGVLIIGIQRKGIFFFHMFFPNDTSAALVILLSAIELMSWVFRVFSLALRLLANMIAGHILLYCISYITYNILSDVFTGLGLSIYTLIVGLIPMSAFVFFLFFEAGVAILQAYIFLVLSSIYINEVI